MTAQFMLLEFCQATLSERVAEWDYPVAWSVAASFAHDITAAVEVRAFLFVTARAARGVGSAWRSCGG